MANRFRSTVERAEAFMRVAHAGQKRKDGSPYATHPAAVCAVLVTELGVTDEDAQVAALLHDVVEDTKVPLTEIIERFGPRVGEMVRLLSKLPEPGESKENMLARYYAGLRAAEPVVRQIKVSDRVHNLRDMAAGTPEFQSRYLVETEMLLADVLCGTPGIEVLQAVYEESRRVFGGNA
jgi:GTP diphosphokinase / guanosine-3',5'-bis(diphosphate) 3'-diphosphatase